ncbi:MAG TPA: ribbon-helix-helix domain-containing protein [Hyphomicrobiaceae bacterium]|nr:ribbon-helix-helix domain-containing protein [Hyphomicrobiaceae bacterium]
MRDSTGHKPPDPQTPANYGNGSAPSRPVKRSFTIAGHRTSISLENAFWHALNDIARMEHKSLASIVSSIDSNRGSAGLSGSVRVWVLDYFRNKPPISEAARTSQHGMPSQASDGTNAASTETSAKRAGP